MDPGEHPMIDTAFGNMVSSGTSLPREAALPAPAMTPTPPVLPLRWLLPLRFRHRLVLASCARRPADLVGATRWWSRRSPTRVSGNQLWPSTRVLLKAVFAASSVWASRHATTAVVLFGLVYNHSGSCCCISFVEWAE